MLRQSAFIGDKPKLKGGLHCHTTRSDGAGSPADVIRLHAENGYDFLALTDHRRYNYENYAPETGVLILPGMEMDRTLPSTGGVHCFHAVCIGPAREDGNGYAHDQRFESGRVANQAEFQPLLDEIHAHNNLTFYCHPEWSNTPSGEYGEQQGHFAMEIWNSGAVIENEQDANAAGWDDLLSQGKRLWGVAVDDGHAMDQHCKGWVVVRAEKTINDVLHALQNGDFYASCGPEILDFYVEDGVAHVKCSPCASIAFRGSYMPPRFVRGDNGLITEASFVLPENKTYIRATVCDAQGRRAWTNPIFLR